MTDKNETKSDKFGRLARARLDKIRHHAGLIMNLAGPTYEYTREDVQWINRELDTIFDEVMAAFDKPKG